MRGRHSATLEAIFSDPVSGSIRWRDIEAMFVALGADVIEREKGVLADKAKASGKPDNVIEKIVESGLKSFYKEVCLLDQPYVHDDKKNVGQAMKEAESKVGGPIKITGFVRYKLGEGIEKQDSDFAAEVAAAAGKS